MSKESRPGDGEFSDIDDEIESARSRLIIRSVEWRRTERSKGLDRSDL